MVVRCVCENAVMCCGVRCGSVVRGMVRCGTVWCVWCGELRCGRVYDVTTSRVDKTVTTDNEEFVGCDEESGT